MLQASLQGDGGLGGGGGEVGGTPSCSRGFQAAEMAITVVVEDVDRGAEQNLGVVDDWRDLKL